MYALSDYLAMIDDHRRTSAYTRALRAAIRPGDVVLELGAGFGYFSVEAARMGAAHVYAVEPNDAIDLGPALAARHGVADRITFLQCRASEVELPVRADLLLEDLRGCSPLLGGRLGILRDARVRLLKPDARFVARHDRLMVAPAALRATGGGDAPVTVGEPTEALSLDDVRTRAGRGWRRIDADGFDPLAPAACWASIDLTAVDGLDVDGRAAFVIERDGVLEGWASWFEAELAGGALISSGPESGGSVYACGWYPLECSEPVRAGDGVAVRLRATHDGTDYVWLWETTITPADGRAPRRSRQSSLGTSLLSAARRARRAAAHVPGVGEALAVQRDLLDAVDGARTLEEIAALLRVRHPARFVDARTALAWTAAELARLDEPPA
ncbi:MAG: class I SAM-dependent methyltransferase [Gemmatimonadetes bacterium]|nr:class I SAM-dependent methyltransferase [Gemmatimonadota bacterium]